MTSYVSRVVSIPPLTATAAFDAVVGTVTRAATARMDLDPGSGHVERTWSLSPYRSRTGRLGYPGRSRRVAVELEVAVWSDLAVELGLRPVHRLRAIDPFADAGHRYLTVLAAEMAGWLDDEMAKAVAEVLLHPALKARPARRHL